ncbi:Na+/H+ antiporter subunit E [Anderseniella sp. Alg231-50]|uniref:Na+/H+ antiporter subunit E n=1 Tax=Anderseniella sp. Alg231-50 TaxID=1922226 RepID=UPI000D55C663
MLQKLGLFVALCVGWMLWSGYFKPLLLGLGLASALVCTYLALRMRKADGEGSQFKILQHVHQLATYWPWLLLEIAKSNVEVAKIILSGKMNIDPVMIRLKAGQATEMGQVIYGNSITLTPGTITVDIEDGDLLVHALAQSGADGLHEGEMDRRITALER